MKNNDSDKQNNSASNMQIRSPLMLLSWQMIWMVPALLNFPVTIAYATTKQNSPRVPIAASSAAPTLRRRTITTDSSFITTRTGSSLLPEVPILARPSTASALANTPGDLTRLENAILRFEGLTVRLVAQSGVKVYYSNNDFNLNNEDSNVESTSDIPFHIRPNADATFVDERAKNAGGWIYISNSEAPSIGHDDAHGMGGGVGAITFDAYGGVINYNMILNGTGWNSGGGRTPWNTWVSCENTPYSNGTIYQVDPYGYRESVPITLGKDYDGRYDSFAYDIRDRNKPYFFVARDHTSGAIHRFTPKDVDWVNDPWNMLQGDGTIDYLILHPNSTDNNSSGTYEWISNKQAASRYAKSYYPNSVGIRVDGSMLSFFSKSLKQSFDLDLDSGSYKNMTSSISPSHAIFTNGQSDQGLIQNILSSQQHDGLNQYIPIDFNTDKDEKEVREPDAMWDTAEWPAGNARTIKDTFGKYQTMLKSSRYLDDITGLAFSPNEEHLYIAYGRAGLLFDITRADGSSFTTSAINTKYNGGV